MVKKLQDSLPEILADEHFCFNCGPQNPCFNRCCSELALFLTPYDILRLRHGLGLSGYDILQTFSLLQICPDSGFPLPMLRMAEGPEALCPFLNPGGCSVYEDRPGACRTYPLGRGTKLTKTGVTERFFMIREPHCLGFENGESRTPVQWFKEEGLAAYNKYNDRYMRLISLVNATGKPLDQKFRSMAILSLFQLENFRSFINQTNMFKHVDISPMRMEIIMENSLAGDEACLDFGFDWLELAIFGKADNLGRKRI